MALSGDSLFELARPLVISPAVDEAAAGRHRAVSPESEDEGLDVRVPVLVPLVNTEADLESLFNGCRSII